MNTQPTSTRTVNQIIDALELAASRVTGSVALIHAMTPMDYGRQSLNVGSAYCVDKRGYFLTALHVVGPSSDSFVVVDSLAETCIVASNVCHDLALVKVKDPTGEFVPVSFATARPEFDEIVAGLGFPYAGLPVELTPYLGRFCGQFNDGKGPHGLVLDGDTLPSALCFVTGQPVQCGYSGGPIINEQGQVVASTIKGDNERGFVIGPSAADLVAFVDQFLVFNDPGDFRQER